MVDSAIGMLPTDVVFIRCPRQTAAAVRDANQAANPS
jgi:hypothetical protein